MRKEVWKNAIDCFRKGESPFSTAELSKLNVTLSECFELSDQISEAMRTYTPFSLLESSHEMFKQAFTLFKDVLKQDIEALQAKDKQYEAVLKLLKKNRSTQAYRNVVKKALINQAQLQLCCSYLKVAERFLSKSKVSEVSEFKDLFGTACLERWKQAYDEVLKERGAKK